MLVSIAGSDDLSTEKTGEQGALSGFDALLSGTELLELLLEARDPLVELYCHADRS